MTAVAIPFADYLEAKYALDQRSLNRDVWGAWTRLLSEKDHSRLLDLGTGTAAMIRRLLEAGPTASLSITGLDKDPELLRIGQGKTAALLRAQGFDVDLGERRISARRDGRMIDVDLVCAPLDRFDPRTDGTFDLITAHAFLDLVPLAATVQRLGRWLSDGGVFYATLCYDGETALFPPYAEETFENRLLAAYDASMEARRVGGNGTGGAHSGRRLHGLLVQHGFEIAAYGSSDWNITPLFGRYRDRDRTCLTALIDMIRDEGARSRAIDPSELAHWYEDRSRLLHADALGIVIHQMDILARRGRRQRPAAGV